METVKYFCKYIFANIRKQNRKVAELTVLILRESLHETERCLLLGRKAMANLDSILKGRAIILLTEVLIVKAMVFQAVMYGCTKLCVY